MIDTRRLQRTLFRMQLDPAFAAAVLAGQAVPWAPLPPAELKLLARAGLGGVVADPGGKRRAQMLGNAASEYVMALAEAGRGGSGARFLAEFPASEAFHRAVALDEPLPLALGAFLEERAAATRNGVMAALALLETRMARARRTPAAPRRLGPGELALSAKASFVSLPDGAFGHAQAVRAAVDALGAAPPPAPGLVGRAAAWLDGCGEPGAGTTETETVLLVASQPAGSYRLRDVAAERLEPDAATLLAATRAPLSDAALAALSREHGFEPSDVAAFVAELVAEGVLERG